MQNLFGQNAFHGAFEDVLGRQTFDLHFGRNGCSELDKPVIEQWLARLDRMPSANAALGQLRRLGVAWYVVTRGTGPPWDRDRRLAAFVERNVAIYAVPGR